LEIVKDIGPRILSFGFLGEENLFFHDIENQITKDVSHIYGKGKKWHIYGGHRLWLSPESDLTYYPDNLPVDIQKIPNGAIIKSPKQDINEVELSVKVEFIADSQVKITHTAKNKGHKKRFSLWGLTVLKSGYTMRLKIDEKKEGLLPNRNIVLWPYTDIHDKRLELTNSEIVIKSDKRVSQPLKIGTYNDNIKAVYEMGEYVFEKCFLGQGEYPDFQCNFECYTNDKIFEIESLSPIKEIAENETFEFWEIWKLKKVAK
jgi:hypothetical protein